jgi:hypothetical protein
MIQKKERLLHHLKKLTDLQFKTVLFEFPGIDTYLPKDATHIEKAIALIELLEKRNQLDNLYDFLIQPREKIPQYHGLLPYMVNRREQLLTLGKAIRAHHNRSCPLLCLIHGDEDECSDMFLERLKQEFLYQVLEKDTHNDMESYSLWGIFNDVDRLHEKMQVSLGEQLCNNPFASLDEISHVVVRKRCPVIFSADVSSKNLQRGEGIKTIHDFINFWAKWPTFLQQDHLILVCLFINYKKDFEKINFFKRIFGISSINQKIRKALNTLELNSFQDNYIVLLPELQSIEKHQVIEWAKVYARDFCNVEVLTKEIHKIFTSADHIAMEPLVFQLKKILERCRYT